MIPVKIKINDGAKIPEYKSEGASGADVFAFLDKEMVVDLGKTVLVPTGVFMEIPYGYEAQIRPRSGLAIKNGITLLNTPGTIDSDYRGELKIILTNFGDSPFVIENHMRIAQMVFAKTLKGVFHESSMLEQSNRGEGGFGHTGV